MRSIHFILSLLLWFTINVPSFGQTPVIPADLIISRQPKPELPLVERGPFTLASLSVGTIQQVFQTPPCLEGKYYLGFQLYYDLGDTQTQIDWTVDLDITLLNNTTVLWTKPLSVKMTDQTFISTVFHDVTVLCDPNYKIRVDAKTISGAAPQSNIYLKFLLYKYNEDVFVPSASLQLNCSNAAEKSSISWTYSGKGVIAYDLEWVFIASHEGYMGTQGSAAFRFKEPVRVTVVGQTFVHPTNYPSGQLFYRARAVGFNPQYPEHRINGLWHYSPCAGLTISNPQPDINWQQQTIFAEGGKYKMMMSYFDGTLRSRQNQTNLSTSGDTTIVGETLYDYEGRRSIDILSVPTSSTSLKYKPSFNPLLASDPTIASNTSSRRKKFHYDNDLLENSIVTTSSGAGSYYSPANPLLAFRKDYIPDSEGYVYSQTEYLNDGTGRVKRQSGVGREFRMDGAGSDKGRPSKFYYGNAAPGELIRLFGTNVGKANHYKKNMMVDPNGQASVSYLDQEGRIIATALAGTPPTNVDALNSYTELPAAEVVMDISSKNTRLDGKNVVTQKVLNTVPNTTYTFSYNFSGLASTLLNIGCVECRFDIKITITDPDGKLVNINTPTVIPGNEALDAFSYERTNIGITDCNVRTTPVDIQFTVNLTSVGDYTINKVLAPSELTFEQVKTVLNATPDIQAKITDIQNSYLVDASNCEICTSCPEAEVAITDAINEIANLDCQNIYQRIVQSFLDLKPNDPEYYPTETEISSHPDYCHYMLCLSGIPSDQFEKQLARVTNWTTAEIKGYQTLLNLATNPYPDPFFRTDGPGSSYASSMQNKLNNVFVASVAYDNDGDGIHDGTNNYGGTILQVTDPTNAAYYIDEDGNPTFSNVTGKHILYFDLMSQRSANQISQPEYLAELDRQRWIFFKSFYLEAKRKTKLEIPAFYNCPETKRLLQEPDFLPKRAEEIQEYGDLNGVTVPISNEEVEAIYASMKFTCYNKKITSADSLTITTRLKNYFNAKPKTLLRYILLSDVGVNAELNAIQTILNTYSCSNLSSIATTEPILCLNDTTITYENKFVPQNPVGGIPLAAQFPTGAESEQFSTSAQSRSVERKRLLSEVLSEGDAYLKEIHLKVEQRMMARMALDYSKPETLNLRSSTSQPIAVQSFIPSPSVYDALIDLYNATTGSGWKNNTGWSTAIPGVPQDVSGWYGVTVDAYGGVVSLNLYNNNLIGSIPSSISNLTFLKILNLSRNKLSGSIPTSIGNLIWLERLELYRNQLTGGIPVELTQLDRLKVLNLSDNNALGGSIPASITSLYNLYLLSLSNCQLTGSLPSSLSSLSNLEYLYLFGNQLTGSLPSVFYFPKLVACLLDYNAFTGSIPSSIQYCTSLASLTLNSNQLTGPIPPELGDLSELRGLLLEANQLTGTIPAELGKLSKLETLSLSSNQLTGPIPPELGQLHNLWMFSVPANQLTGEIPAEFGNLSKLKVLSLQMNSFTGTVPASLNKLTKLQQIRLNNNKFSGNISNAFLGSIPTLTYIAIQNNFFTISDFIYLKTNATAGTFNCTPQALIPGNTTLPVTVGNDRTLTTFIDRATSPPSNFQWFNDVAGANDVPLNSASPDGHTFVLPNITAADNGKKYYVKITNSAVPGLTLVSPTMVIIIDPDSTKTISICKDYGPGEIFTGAVQKCLDDAAVENEFLIGFAIDKMLEEEATDFYAKQSTNCLSNVIEHFTYAYTPKEYHYTLYYYDQAGNLIQTVPPQGVNPLTTSQVTSFLNGSPVDPNHRYVTVYQYNSFDQFIWQKTPDAGESRFWYNDKVQLRLSQNAQQLKDNNYAYTKYDRQGRITEVGEMNTTNGLPTLLTQLEDTNFPASPAYALADITRTFYDIPNTPIQAEFPQEFLRNRVAWVEVHEKDAADVIATYYSYDIHGNVKALLQQVPGLPNKRTDYRYDVVSGNVNYVMYQYGQPDQFIHRYKYDADNRIKEVATSTDGYLWDTEATYRYYLHGPLARVELGQYRVQGMDYYYTLQGWIKGVNMPFASDPGNDGYSGQNLRAGRDVFAYTLGYFENDYKPRNAAITIADSRDQLWPRFKGLMGSTNTGLFNGNIAWMITDLKKIGQQKGARSKGMQAMLYKYDQLHRIIQSRSLTTYASGSGFASRTTAPAAYDEDFTYDANGNILSLKRRNNIGLVMDNFFYRYYTGTNKLRYNLPIVRDTVYSGAIASNNKVYRRITVQGTAFAPAGKDVVIKAIENIDIDQGFTKQPNATFRAYVLSNDEGAYNYDAIGNLVWDQDQGVRITWTPHGKVRQLSKGDGTVTTFRYDGAGNRIEKKMVKADNSTTVTRYIRDASGNVMAIYNGITLTEQPIYGSARLGVYRGGRIKAQRRLGVKNYELANHLGNVLSVVTDNIRMTVDSTWATVISANDYYAFGSGMPARNFDDDTYRYGFNGKEKDSNGEFGNTTYDYGFRIYNPTLGRFFSVDPITKNYPMLTPYQFASNRPIDGIDLDGLEFYKAGKLDLIMLGYKTGQYSVEDIAISQKSASILIHGSAPPEQFDDAYEQQEYIGFVKIMPNRNTHFTGKGTTKVTNVPVYSKSGKGSLVEFFIEALNYYQMLSNDQQEKLRLKSQAASLDQAIATLKGIEDKLPPEIRNNPVIKADIVNFAGDFRTLPKFGENGVNGEYLIMIQTIGRALYDNAKEIQSGTDDLLNYSTFIEFNTMHLDRPENKGVLKLTNKPKKALQESIDNYMKSKTKNRGGLRYERGN